MKYIVYCTVCLENKYIYVGVHQCVDASKFDNYIGCGVYTNMPSTYNKPKTRFQAAVKKYGPKKFKRITIKVFENEDDAYCLESQIVDERFLARKDIYNQVLGGKIGLAELTSKPCFQYSKDGKFIAEYKSQQQAATSVNRAFSTIGFAVRNKISAAGFFWASKKVDKLDLSQYKTETNKIQIFQYSKSGEYECCYDSISDAARTIGSTTSNIVRAIKLGFLTKGKYFSYVFNENFSSAKTEKIRNTPIYQYSLSGDFIKEYKNQLQAQKELGFSSEIYKAIKLGRTVKGFQWSLEKLQNMPDISKKEFPKARKVGQYDINGNLIKIFNTVSACKKQYCGCERVLREKVGTCKGFVFKYIE